MPRSFSRTVLAVMYGLLAINAWAQVPGSDDPPVLTTLQFVIGLVGVAATRGVWVGARWAPVAALGYGAVTAGMLVALPFILGLEPEARAGIWMGAAAVLLLSVGIAWYLQRVIRRDTTPSTVPSGA